MSDRPDFTANTALNAVADTLDNLPVSINAQTLGSLAVDIAAQSAGDIDINLNSNSVGSISTIIDGQAGDVDIRFSSQTGNVDINFEDQTGGVESATEFAASQQNTVTNTVTVNVSGGGLNAEDLFVNNTGNPVVTEFVSGGQETSFVDSVLVRVLVQDAFGSNIAEVEANPVNLPLSFDPGVLIPANGEVRVVVESTGGSAVDYRLSFIGREVV